MTSVEPPRCARLLVPAREVFAVEMHRKVRDPDHGQVEPGHDPGALGAAGRAVEVHPLLHGLRPELDRPLDVEELALMGEGAAGERLADDVAAFAEAGAGVCHGDAEGIVFEACEAAPEADMEIAPAQLAQHGDLARESERAVPGQDQDAGPEVHVGIAPGEMGEHHQRARRREIVREVVLDHPECVVAEPGDAIRVHQRFDVLLRIRRAGLADRRNDRSELDLAHGSSSLAGSPTQLRQS